MWGWGGGGGGVGGDTLKCIRRLGPFWEVRNFGLLFLFIYFLFYYFFLFFGVGGGGCGGGGGGGGGGQKIWGMKFVWILFGVISTGLVLGVISMHFRVFS